MTAVVFAPLNGSQCSFGFGSPWRVFCYGIAIGSDVD
jgi:hypothetical protein